MTFQFHEQFNSVDCENVIRMECYASKKIRSREKSSLSANVFIVLPYYRLVPFMIFNYNLQCLHAPALLSVISIYDLQIVRRILSFSLVSRIKLI